MMLYKFKLIILVFILFSVLFFFKQSLFSNEASYEEFVTRIEAIKDRIPNDDDYFRICQTLETNLSGDEMAKLFGVILSLQKQPRVNRETLLAIFKAKRESLNQCKISYSEIVQNPPNSKYGPAGQTSRSYIFAFSKNKLFLERYGKRWADDYEHSIISYDGNDAILVAFPKDNIPNADITAMNSFQIFYQLSMPLFYTMHIEESRYDTSINTGRDIVKFLEGGAAHVFQQEKMINGRICVSLSSTIKRFYLDVERDFSIVRIEQYVQENAKLLSGMRGNFYSKRKLLFTSDHFDHIDGGNGNWFPSKIKNTYYTNGKPDGLVEITVRDIKTQNIPDSLFSDVIPENAFVFDGVRKMTYMQSDSPSIDSLLENTVKSKRVMIFRYISITAGILMIIIALALKYLAYLKNKREHENKTEEEIK